MGDPKPSQLCLLVALLSGCGASASTAKPQSTTPVSTTTFVSSWKSPTAHPLQQNQLVWAGTSKTTNPPSLNDLITEVASATATELGHIALVAPQ
jgi:hypothetical protein